MPVPNQFANVTTSIPLSQLDANFNTPITLGNTAIQLGNTVTTLNNMTLANATVSSGNVTVTSASVSGNLTFTGTGNRILGDFSNATVANRVMFQTSTANGQTQIHAIPNGTIAAGTTVSNFSVEDSTSISTGNGSQGAITNVQGTEIRLSSGIRGTGTYLPLTFYTGGSEAMRIGATAGSDRGTLGIGYTSLTGVGQNGLAVLGNVGIGTSSPATTLNAYNATSAIISVDGDSTTQFRASRYSTDVSGPQLLIRKARGTLASPSAVNSADQGGVINFQVYGGTNFRPVAQVQGACETYTSDTNVAGALIFGTNAGGTTITERMRIDSSGNVLVTSAGGGLGYGTGSGGTVTQATNKSTAVTLNKPTGQITMNNAALAAGASVAFQFNNSLISASDVVVCNPGNFGNYTAQVYFVTAGACGIRITNISGGSLSEAVTINFAVIKGATS